MKEDKLEIKTARLGSFKSSELTPTTASNDTFTKLKTDRLSKSYNAAAPSPTTAVNLQVPTPLMERRASLSDSDHPINDMTNLLHSLPFFSGLPSSDAFIQEINGLLKLRPFKVGDTVIHHGDVAKCMYLIVRGELSIMSEDNEIEYATLTAGSFVGEIGVLFNTVRTATVICKTKSLLVALTTEDIQSKLDKYPDIKEHIQLKGNERLQALEIIKSQKNESTEKEEKRGKAGYNVKRSSSFKATISPDSSFNAGQLLGNSFGVGGLLSPDSMNILKNKASSRRSSLNPETSLGISLDCTPDGSLLPNSEPAFLRRKNSFNHNEAHVDESKLFSKSFNASRRKSSIRFELGDLAISVDDVPSSNIFSTAEPQIEITVNSDYKMSLEDLSSPVGISTSAGPPELCIPVPAIMIETPSLDKLAEDNTVEHISTIENRLKSKESEPRRISIAVWSDPKLLKVAQKKEGGIEHPPKESKSWTGILNESFGEIDDEDELNFLHSSTSDSFDTGLSLTPTEEVLINFVRYLSFEDLFKIRGLCQSMPAIISAANPPKLKSINLSPYFRRLNDRGLIAISNLCGMLIEKLNLHAAYQINDRSIETLAKSAPNLKYLNLSDLWELCDVSLVALSRYCPSISHLDLSNCRKITDKGLLGVLESCSKLSILSLSYCKNLTNKVFDHESWSRIKELNLHRCTGIGDRGFEFWPLFIDDFGWPGTGSRMLASSTDWDKASEDILKGSFCKSGITLDNLSYADGLGDLSTNDINDENDDCTSEKSDEKFNQRNLQYADSLSDSFDKPEIMVNELSENISDSSRLLTHFSLQSLDLRDCSFLSDTAIASIASVCSQLRILNLSFCCSLTEDFGRYLGCRKLSHLDVSFCGGAVNDEFILEITTGLHRLKGLSIRGCIQITDQGVDHIVKYSKLEKISYSQCKSITSRGRDLLNENYQIVDNNSICEGIAAWS